MKNIVVGFVAFFITFSAIAAGGLGSKDPANTRLGKKISGEFQHFGAPYNVDESRDDVGNFRQGTQVNENRQNRSNRQPKKVKLTKEEKRCRDWQRKARSRCKGSRNGSRKCNNAQTQQEKWCKLAAK